MSETLTNFKPNEDIPERLKKDYGLTLETVEEMAGRAGKLPSEITTPEEHALVADFVKEARGLEKRVEASRVAEKDPYLDAERKVDAFFNAIKERAANMAVKLNERVTVYLKKKADAERREREAEAERLRLLEAQRLKDAQEAEDRRLAAQKKLDEEQAKPSPSNFDTMEAADEKTAATSDQNEAIQDAIDLGNRAAEIQASASAKPADLARTYTEKGTLSTLVTTWKHLVEDYDRVPLDDLRPYFTNAEIDKAIRGFVRKNKGAKTLAGVRIYEDSNASQR